jgi:hypothetical protein
MCIPCPQNHSQTFLLIKDIALILVSTAALFSGFLFNKRGRKDKWVEDFRKQVVAVISQFSKGSKDHIRLKWNIPQTSLSQEQKEYLLQLEQAALSVILFLNEKNKLHNELIQKMYLIINMANRLEFSEEIVDINEVLTLSKTIIQNELNDYWFELEG